MASTAATANSYNPSRDDFAAMLDESFAGGNLQESSVIKGKVVAIEKDMAVIDVGLKTEGRVALREFSGPGRESELKVGDEVEVFLDRIENALGEAVLSRDKARREESWGKLEKAFQNNEKVNGVIFNQVKGGFTERILDAVEEHLDLVADLELAFASGAGKLAQRDAALGLQADVDDGHVLFDRNHLALDDGAFLKVSAGEGFIQHRGEIVAAGVVGICRSSRSHLFSKSEILPAFGLRAYRA